MINSKKNSHKLQIQLKSDSVERSKNLFEEQRNGNEGLNILRETLQKTLIILNPFWTLKRGGEEGTGSFSQGYWEQMKAGIIQVDREKRIMFGNRSDMTVKIAEQGNLNDQVLHNNSQVGPTMSHRCTPQNNQQPLKNCTGFDWHYKNGYNNNLYNGFPSFHEFSTRFDATPSTDVTRQNEFA